MKDSLLHIFSVHMLKSFATFSMYLHTYDDNICWTCMQILVAIDSMKTKIGHKKRLCFGIWSIWFKEFFQTHSFPYIWKHTPRGHGTVQGGWTLAGPRSLAAHLYKVNILNDQSFKTSAVLTWNSCAVPLFGLYFVFCKLWLHFTSAVNKFRSCVIWEPFTFITG